jgi:hypothetical protein
MKHSSNQDMKEYLVEKIVNKKVREGKVFYLVKWDNYPEMEYTWEPESKLENLKELIKEFEDENEFKSSNDKSVIILQNNHKSFPPEGSLEIDRPKEIRRMKIIRGELFMKVKWFPRVSGLIPRQSLIKYDAIRNVYPLMVLEFLERKITLNDISISEILKENKMYKD